MACKFSHFSLIDKTFVKFFVKHLRRSFLCVETLNPHNCAIAPFWALPRGSAKPKEFFSHCQLYCTPQSLRDSSPNLREQLICCWLLAVYSSLPGVGRVRRSRERVQIILTASPWGCTIGDDSTPQSLRDSPPILVGQLVCCLLSVVYSSLPKVGRVRRSRERVWKLSNT